MSERVLLLGATTNEERIAFEAAELLVAYGHDLLPVGVRKGEVAGRTIINHKEIPPQVDTITLYVGPKIQQEWYEYILRTAPKRIIFNPGTENKELVELAKEKGIDTEEACTLVLLKTKQF